MLRPVIAVAVSVLASTLAFSTWAQEPAVENAPEEILGDVHSTGNFRSLVRDPATGEFLAPNYRLLGEQLLKAQRRVKEAAELGFGDEKRIDAPPNFLPYPELVIRFPTYRSRVVAILDSGVMEEHPLLEGRILEIRDFTNEGDGDECGHGTVQTIRHALFEPRARFLVLKVAKRDCRIRLSALMHALRFLKQRNDVGYIYMAGGIDITTNPDGVIACERAEEVVRHHDLGAGAFVSTTGNAGSTAKWCPAEAEGVTGLQVLDVDTYSQEFGESGGMAVLQKGPYSSFPDIDPLPLGEFYLRYGSMFLDEREFDTAREYARKAGRYPDFAVSAIRLEATVFFRSGDRQGAADVIEAGIEAHPDSPVMSAELAVVRYRLGELDKAAPLFETALAHFPDNAQLLFHHGLFVERTGEDFDLALARFEQAAERDPAYLSGLIAFAGRRFYRDDYARAIAGNEAAERIDLTFTAAAYNIAISRLLSGDEAGARTAIERYSSLPTRFLGARDIPDAKSVESIIDSGTTLDRHLALSYHYGTDRRHAREYPKIAELVELGVEERVTAIRKLPAGGVDKLIRAALYWSRRLAERNHLSVALGDARGILVALFDAHDLNRPNRIHAAIAEGLGRIAQRAGEFADAADWSEREARLLANVRARDAENALFRASVAALDLKQWSRAERLQREGMATSTEIYEDDQYGVVLTALTPGLLAIEALLAIKRGDAEAANDVAGRAFVRNQSDLFNGIVLAMARIAAGREKVADQILGILMRDIRYDTDKLDDLERLFALHPSLEMRYENGELLKDVVAYARRQIAKIGVELTSAVNYPFEKFFDREKDDWAYPFGSCVDDAPNRPQNGVTVAVIGTGLLGGHPCLDSSVAGLYDLIGGDGLDRNGATTAQAMYLVQLGQSSYELYSLRILNDDGVGSIEALKRALAAVIVIRPQLTMTHVETNHHDPHLVGLATRAATRSFITAQAPEAGRGTVFPMMLGRDILIAK